ncbi:MAG: hypothetical protein EB158_07445 [Nitrosopumilaceae archaeon]|nr:hypothetical protein [Nitrosopumilaceae archaeon]
MTKTLTALSVLMAVLLSCGVLSANPASAKSSNFMTEQEKMKSSYNAKQLAEETRKKALEKTHLEFKAKKDDSKKQIALEAMKKIDYIKKTKK